jgi:trk system potassium uptake protein TrkA
MHIVIVGGGEVGFGISRRLAARHECVVIDNAPQVAERFNTLDVQFLAGNGTSPDVLKRAGVATCDFLIACTGVDEVNILAALIGNRLGSPTTICLVSRDDLLQPMDEGDLMRVYFGIDRVIWPEAQLAEDMQRIIATPEAIDAEEFAGGRIQLLEYRVVGGSPLTRGPLSALDLPHGALVVAVRRGDEFFIPRGSTRLIPGDKVFIMGTRDAMRVVQQRVGGGDPNGRQVVTIIGGGDVGLRLAQALERRSDVSVRIIERDAARGQQLAAILRRTLVLHGDGTDVDLLESEEIGASDVLVSVIDNDERNLFASLLGRQLGIKRIITRVGKPANLRLFERLGVDVALSAKGAAVAAIVHQVEGGKLNLLAVLEEGQAEVVEIVVPASHPPTALRQLRALPESIVGAIIRDDVVIVPGGQDEIRPGDHLIVFTTAAEAEAVRDYFTRSA